MVDTVFKALLFLSPIVYGANIDLDYFDFIFFRTGVVVLFMASLLDTPKRQVDKKLSIVMFSLLAIGLFNIFTSTFNGIVLRSHLNMFFAAFGIWLIYTYCKDVKSCFKWIAYAALINMAVLFCQKAGYNPILNKTDMLKHEISSGIIGNGPRLGTYLALTFPFLMQVSLLLIIPYVVCAFILKQYVMLLVLPLLFFILKKKVYKIILVGLMLLSAPFIYSHVITSLLFRWTNCWKPALTEFFKRPLLGYGLGNFNLPTTDTASCSYLWFIFGVGILGAAWLAYTFRQYYKSIDITLPSLAIVGLMAICLIEYPIEIQRLSFTIIGIVAFFLLKGEKVCE